MATNPASCLASERCSTNGECAFDESEQRCVTSWQRASSGLMVTGIVGTVAGGIGLLTAAGLAAATDFDEDLGTAALGVGVASFGMLGLSIPLIVIGARREPRENIEPEMMGRLGLAPGGATFQLTF